MSGAAEASSNSSTTKATIDQSQQTPNQLQSQKPAQQLEEDDEFEDFPVEDWGDEETDLAQGEEANAHLWEESWDDDERNEDFAQILKEEMQKVENSKR